MSNEELVKFVKDLAKSDPTAEHLAAAEAVAKIYGSTTTLETTSAYMADVWMPW